MTTPKPSHVPTEHPDEEYKEAIQPFIDNNMRTDILGPHFCKVLKNHTPASDAVVELLTKKLIEVPSLKIAIKAIIEEHNKETKMKWVDRAIGSFLTLLLGFLLWLGQLIVSQALKPGA